MRDINQSMVRNKIYWLNRFSRTRAKQRLHRRRKRVYECSFSRRKNQKFFVRTIHWNLGEYVKFYHGVTALQHRIDPRHMASLKETYDERKKVLQQHCCNQDWKKGGGLTLWNAVAVCEMSKTFWQTGKLRMKDDFLRTTQRANNTFWSNG